MLTEPWFDTDVLSGVASTTCDNASECNIIDLLNMSLRRDVFRSTRWINTETTAATAGRRKRGPTLSVEKSGPVVCRLTWRAFSNMRAYDTPFWLLVLRAK
uniref:Uncharacterized protein n=1 Tax=Grammatophora oceanica TaxID=210454 RepID=A0A7S1USE3_9STRA